MRAIVSGDHHLSIGTWSDRPDIVGDSYRAFEQIVDIAINMRLPLFLLGDLFDKRRPDPWSVGIFCRQMDRMETAGLLVLVIQGQHELDRENPWFSVHPWPKHMHKAAMQVDDQLVAGLDWLPRGELQAALGELPPDTGVLLAHEVWQEFMGGVGVQDGAFADVPYAEWLLTGDFHETQVVKTTGKTGQLLTVLSSGSTHMRSIAEPPQKCVFLLDTSMSDPTPIYLKTRPYFEFTVQSVEDLTLLCNFLRNGLTIPVHCDQQLSPLVRVIFFEDVPEVYERVTTASGGNCHLFWKRLPRRMEMEIAVRELPQSVTESLTAAVSVATMDPRVRQRCARLLASPDPDAETKEQYAEFMRTACPQTTSSS